MRTFEQAQEEAMPTPEEPPDTFPGGFERGDIVYRRGDISSPVRHGCVTRLAYDTDGEPLVIVHWPHVGMCVEAPEDLRQI